MGTIRPAAMEDLDRAMEVYALAQQFMVKAGNPNQWQSGFPYRSMIEHDIEEGHMMLWVDGEDVVQGCFAFLPGPEHDYDEIFEGAWPDSKPYDVVHRVATAQQHKGIGGAMMDWALARAAAEGKPLRIDTHRDNKPMQRLILSRGFSYCGIVHIHRNGEERLAYAHA